MYCCMSRRVYEREREREREGSFATTSSKKVALQRGGMGLFLRMDLFSEIRVILEIVKARE